jgi:hypothetical protein
MTSVVVPFCTNEHPFLKPLLQELVQFSDDVLICMGDHLCDGQPQDVEAFVEAFRQDAPQLSSHPRVQFVKYVVDTQAWDAMKRDPNCKRPRAYVMNLARATGVHLAKHDWIWLIDADEIPEGARVQAWLEDAQHGLPSLNPRDVYKFANYWYFKHPTYQALQLEDSVMLMHRTLLTPQTLFNDYERGWMHALSGARQCHNTVPGLDGLPMFHHYSWVRSRAALATKIQLSAHKDDAYKDVTPVEMVDAIYKDEGVNDVVNRYRYRVVENRFGLVFE